MIFETDEHYLHDTHIAGQSGNSLRIATSHWHKKDEEYTYSIIKIETGCMTIQSKITPDEARQLAAILITLANEVEAHDAQLAESLQPA